MKRLLHQDPPLADTMGCWRASPVRGASPCSCSVTSRALHRRSGASPAHGFRNGTGNNDFHKVLQVKWRA